MQGRQASKLALHGGGGDCREMAGQLSQQFEVQGEERLYMVLEGMEKEAEEEGVEEMPDEMGFDGSVDTVSELSQYKC